MDNAFADQIRTRAQSEKTRRSYPEGFPALPPVPAERYCDPAFFELERKYVFGCNWLFVAHVDELPEAGDVILLDQFPQPLLLVRGTDGQIRCFFNTCRHRGAPLVREPRAKVKTRLVCQYHSWSYDLEGRLHGIPDSENFTGLDKACLGLGTVRCDTWAGMIFINLDPNAIPLREFLAPVMQTADEEIGDSAGSPSRFVRKTVRRLRGNWKLAIDANIETYHVNTVHPGLAPVLEQKGTAIWLMANGHSRMFTSQRVPLERNPLLGRFPNVNPVANEGVYAYLIYPNTVTVISPTLIFTTQTWPVAPGEMRYDVYYLMANPIDDQNRKTYERAIAATEKILEEDLGNLAFMQASYETKTIDSIPLNYQERRIYYLHEAIDRNIGDELIPSRLRVPSILTDFVEA
ncbi:MAG TPA: aromatic ring-hydroxylating dioxygenase subunit alpha [Candidatus Binataceae bacterium]|nr:aromatic ring-hydroxylating dioxygenase subunit alpha [Candidatus Binataceae bacterium]